MTTWQVLYRSSVAEKVGVPVTRGAVNRNAALTDLLPEGKGVAGADSCS